MTNELEKTFFDTFEIEPKTNQVHSIQLYYHIEKYPEITDRILLELICICNSTYINGYTNYFMATGKTKEELKEEILKKCISLSKDIKQQVRTLFEEE